jgi:hypothetical protein
MFLPGSAFHSSVVLRKPLGLQYRVDGLQQRIRSGGPGQDSVHGLQASLGQFQGVGDHDDWNLWPDLLDFIRHDRSVQQAQVIFEHDRIHRVQHQDPQTIASIGCGDYSVSFLL